jgi:hypothetical protein
MSFAGKLMELEIIMLNEISQAQKAKYRKFSLICEPSPKMMMRDDNSDDDDDDGI